MFLSTVNKKRVKFRRETYFGILLLPCLYTCCPILELQEDPTIRCFQSCESLDCSKIALFSIHNVNGETHNIGSALCDNVYTYLIFFVNIIFVEKRWDITQKRRVFLNCIMGSSAFSIWTWTKEPYLLSFKIRPIYFILLLWNPCFRPCGTRYFHFTTKSSHKILWICLTD